MGMGKTRVRTLARTQKRWIKNFEEKKAEGNYEPYFRTQDITSSGFKARFPCPRNTGRVYHLLSQNETNTLITLLHDPMVIDIKEQYAVTDLPKSKAFARALEINHPKHVWSSTDSVITFDFFCTMKFGPPRAISVKPAHLLTDPRTEQKLALERALAESMEIDFEIATDEKRNSEEVRNIFRFLRGANLPEHLIYRYVDWISYFRRILTSELHSPLNSLVKKIADIQDISFVDSFTLMQHGFWVKDITSDPELALLPEYSSYYLGVQLHA